MRRNLSYTEFTLINIPGTGIMALQFQKLDIADLILITPQVFHDERGFFLESYKKSEFLENGISTEFIQSNHSRSTKGVLRGLHYQTEPQAQAKLVRCIRGRIFDIAVDIRRNSPDFGKWIGIYLSAENMQMLFIPAGFAHGFYTISDEAEILYQVDREYHRESDRGIIWNDPDLNIAWPQGEVILSEKDKALPGFKQTFI